MDAQWIPFLSIIAGGLLTALGSFIQALIAARREDRREEREHRKQLEQWEREDRLQQERQDREDEQRQAEERAAAYKAFRVATTFSDAKVVFGTRRERLELLNTSFTDVLLVATDVVRAPARDLYHAAADFIRQEGGDSELLERIDNSREHFWEANQLEQEEPPDTRRAGR